MARKQPQEIAEETVEVVEEEFVLSWGGFTINPEVLSPTVVGKLLAYGFAKSLQDSASGVKKKALGEGLSEDDALARVHSYQQARFDSIVDGTYGTKVEKPTKAPKAPKGDTVETVMLKIAKETIKAAVKARGGKSPTGAALDQLTAKYLDKYADKTRTEAEARLASQSEASGDLGDLLDL